MSYILRPAVTLFITAVVSVALLSVVYNFTLEPIQMQRTRAQEAAMREVLPQATDFHNIEAESSGNIIYVYEATSGGNTVGYVIGLSPQGYSGNIDMVVGISEPHEKVSGIRILRQTETPGLGALAVREDFYRHFNDRPLVQLGVARVSPGEHDISAITAATITTRAITDAVNEAIRWYQGSREISGTGGGR